jgi:type II secretory pathway pseudopilin PulG
MSNAFSISSARRGLTLVEVVAGLLLLATLLTAVLTAFRTHAAQIRHARERLQANDMANELLRGWLAQGAMPPIGTQKPLDGTDGWAWRIAADGLVQTEPVRIESIRVEIVRSGDALNEEILSSVSVVAPGGATATK